MHTITPSTEPLHTVGSQLDAAGGWLRKRFTETGVIQFEDRVDTGEEYSLLDEVARDRQAAAR